MMDMSKANDKVNERKSKVDIIAIGAMVGVWMNRERVEQVSVWDLGSWEGWW